MRRAFILFVLLACIILPITASAAQPGNPLGGNPRIAHMDGETYLIHQGGVWQLTAEGLSPTPLSDGPASGHLNAADGYLYWTCDNQGEQSYGIYRIASSEGTPQKLHAGIVHQMRVLGGFVYSLQQTGGAMVRHIFRMGTDGHGATQLSGQTYMDFCVDGEALYGYWERFDPQTTDWRRGIDRIGPMDGAALTLVTDSPRVLIGTDGGHVYYLDGDRALCRVMADGSGGPEQILPDVPNLSALGLSSGCVASGAVYAFEDIWRVNPWASPAGLQGGTAAGNPYRLVPGQAKEVLHEGVCNDIQVAGPWMLFREYDEEAQRFEDRLLNLDSGALVALD